MAATTRFALELKGIDGLTRTVRRKCVKAAARVIRKHARRQAPRKTGKLRGRIGATMRGETAAVRSTAPHSHLILLGVKQHPIFSPGGHPLRIPTGSGDVLRRGPFEHPGLPATPFMSRGVDAARGEINTELRNIMTKPEVTL